MGESSLLRGIKIIDALAEHGSEIRYTDIREQVLNGLNPGSTSKILNELCEAGVLENGGNGYRLTRRVPTLAAVLAAGGYMTAAFTEGGNISSVHGFDLGFDCYWEKKCNDINLVLKRAEQWIEANK